jgi:DNA-binding phage protein
MNGFPSLDEIKVKLEPYNLAHVARDSGVTPTVLYNFMAGRSVPTYENTVKLVVWLKNHARD